MQQVSNKITLWWFPTEKMEQPVASVENSKEFNREIKALTKLATKDETNGQGGTPQNN